MMEDEEDETIQSMKKPNFLVPDKLEQVVLLPSELSYDEMSPVQKIISTKPETSNFELKPLSFTVNENFFDLENFAYKENKFIENRGLLQLIEEREEKRFSGSIWDGNFKSYKVTIKKHIELQFPTQKGFVVHDLFEHHGERHDFAKTRIYYDEIESISFNQDYFGFKSKIIFKLKPEKTPHRLAIDKVEREVVIHIARKIKNLLEKLYLRF